MSAQQALLGFPAVGDPERGSITERVLRWLNEAGPGTYAIGSIQRDLEGLTRRQVTSALHGLEEYGLQGQLERTGKGIWTYEPLPTTQPQALVPDGRTGVTYTWPTGVATEVPVGWKFSGTVVSKRAYGGGHFEYLVQAESGALLSVRPIFRLEAAESMTLPAENETRGEW